MKYEQAWERYLLALPANHLQGVSSVIYEAMVVAKT